MPYVVQFVRRVAIVDREQYINDCCIGGDLVLSHLLPALRERYGSGLDAVQEDWGWFVWFEHAGVKLAVDVHTNDPVAGEFQIHLTSRRPRRLWGARVEDTPELEQLKALIAGQLRSWPVERISIERADANYITV